MAVSKNQGPQYRPQIVGLLLCGHLRDGPPICGISQMASALIAACSSRSAEPWLKSLLARSLESEVWLVELATWVSTNECMHLHVLRMGDCQNHGPILGPLDTRRRIILRTRKETIILTTTHMGTCLGRCESLCSCMCVCLCMNLSLCLSVPQCFHVFVSVSLCLSVPVRVAVFACLPACLFVKLFVV